jgi:hypothetical protein
MRNPNRSIDENHTRGYLDRRLGMGRSSLSVPPNFARRLLLSLAMRASSPSFTKEVFSLIPVICDAFFRILSSMFNVVLICINMHYLYIYVNPGLIALKLICGRGIRLTGRGFLRMRKVLPRKSGP